MKFTKRTSSSSSSEGWGMGFLLVFFPEENQNQPDIAKRPKNLNLFPFSSSFKLADSFNLVHRAQSTISICLLLVFTTILFFTLSTLPPAATTAAIAARRLYGGAPRRHMREFAPSPPDLPPALQGMGALYGRGTRAMSDVFVAHAPESLSPTELKLFLRLFFWSGLAAKADLVLVFPSRTAQLDDLILRERDSFLNLLTRYVSGDNFTNSAAGFDPTHFTKVGKKERESGEPIWGRKNRGNHSEGETASTGPSYGSVVGFVVDELDPENSLSGFLEHIPMSLRRWASYPMLLGRVRRNFKHVVLVDIKDLLPLGDPLARVRNHSPESVFLRGLAQSSSSRHGRRNSAKTELTRKNSVDPSFIMGGSKGVRRLAGAMLTEVVRYSIQHQKKKSSVTESGIFNHLVGNEYLLKDVNLIVSTEPLPELSSLTGSGSKRLFSKNYGIVRKGNGNLDVINSIVMKQICSFSIVSKVYSDC